MKSFQSHLAIALFVLIAFIVYYPAIGGDFIWDDDVHLTKNIDVERVGGLRNIWTPGAMFQFYPLTFTSFWIEHKVWGFNPLGYHLTNIILHLLCSFFIWRILISLGIPGAPLASLIFLFHPVNVESVAWITERKNVLAGAFYFGSLLLYIRFLQGSGNSFYIFSILCFILALFSKTAICVLPAVILLIVWWQKGSITKKDLYPTIPYFTLSWVFATVTIYFEEKTAGAHGQDWDYSFWERLIIAGKNFWFYLYKTFIPLNLYFPYPRWGIDFASPLNWIAPISFFVLIGTLWIYRHRVGRGPLCVILYFAGALFPALGFFNIYYFKYTFTGDHFQYFAIIGPISLFSAIIVTQKYKAIPVLSASILLILSFLTSQQNQIYKDKETIWLNAISKNPNSSLAHHNLGKELEAQGHLEDALKHYQNAMQFSDDIPVVNAGRILERLGRDDEAETLYKRGIDLGRNPVENNLNLAHFYYRMNRIDESTLFYKIAIKLNPRSSEAHYNLGNIYGRQGKYDEAEESFHIAMSLDQSLALPHYGLGVVYQSTDRPGKAIESYKRALSLDPKLEQARLKINELINNN